VQVIEDLDLVRAADIARRCDVSRTTVTRWRPTDPQPALSALPPPHLTIGGRAYWSWPLLKLHDPGRFPNQVERGAP
jgi:hypothetical protein